MTFFKMNFAGCAELSLCFEVSGFVKTPTFYYVLMTSTLSPVLTIGLRQNFILQTHSGINSCRQIYSFFIICSCNSEPYDLKPILSSECFLWIFFQKLRVYS